MSNSMNKVILMGNLGDKPELKAFPSGDPYLTFRLCTNEPYKAPGEESWSTRPEWHNVSFAGRSVAGLADLLDRGKQVVVEGRIQARSYQDDNGVTKYFTEVKARHVMLTNGRREMDGPSFFPHTDAEASRAAA